MQERLPFVLANTAHGAVIVNRLDYVRTSEGYQYGVGCQLLTQGAYDPKVIELLKLVLRNIRDSRPEGGVVLDIGANIGIVTLEFSWALAGWGEVWAFEPQKLTYYALAGNIALANCFNVTATQAAVSDTSGTIQVPRLDPTRPASFGSLEIEVATRSDDVGQEVDRTTGDVVPVVTVDALALQRCDFMKIDVEGMEVKVVNGARRTIERFRPLIFAEVIKTDAERLRADLVAMGYHIMRIGHDILAVHKEDPLYPHYQGFH
jgi:FkbM family methyltransferase